MQFGLESEFTGVSVERCQHKNMKDGQVCFYKNPRPWISFLSFAPSAKLIRLFLHLPLLVQGSVEIINRGVFNAE